MLPTIGSRAAYQGHDGTEKPDAEVRMNARDEEFCAFVAARRGELLRLARLLAPRDEHSAEDLVQTALMKLYAAWPRVQREGAPEAYARRILVNSAYDESRRARRRPLAYGEVPDAPSVSDPYGPEGLPHDERRAVRAALSSLPARMRTTVVLRDWVGLDVNETASLLGCSPGTVKSQTAEGRARLRDLLSRYQPATPRPSTSPAMPLRAHPPRTEILPSTERT